MLLESAAVKLHLSGVKMKENTAAVIKTSLKEKFSSKWDECSVLFFSAPCGCGKTTTVRELIARKRVQEIDVTDGKVVFDSVKKNCDVIFIDDFQIVQDRNEQQILAELIRRKNDLHFVILSRGPVPGALMPFIFAGKLETFSTEDLLFDRLTTQKFLEAYGIKMPANDISAIQQDIKGYPAAMEILRRKLIESAEYSKNIYNEVKRDLFIYYDETVYRRYDDDIRSLLLCMASFEEGFSLELARMVSGNSNAGELIEEIMKTSTMLRFDSDENYNFWPVFRKCLLWEMQHEMNENDQKEIFKRAALYFELHDDIGKALIFYSKADDSHKISELLVKNSEQHPGVGHFYEMEKYYYALSDENIRKSPALMSGMSMLTAMNMDNEASERWYSELQEYASKLKKTDSEYKNARSRLAYLDIALPQRGITGFVELMKNIFVLMQNREISLPAFSVTSTLPSIMNGGKDFCEWSKKDTFLYATMKIPVEYVLGKDGVGLADCGLCESMFEKGEDVSKSMLTLMSRFGEIQVKGTPDIEFAVTGLLARIQISQGKVQAALNSLQNIREKYVDMGYMRFLPNMDAAICRTKLRMGDIESARRWLNECATARDAHLRTMWRYQYMTAAVVMIADDHPEEAILILAPLISYCEYCARIMDSIYIHVLMSICYYRLEKEEWRSELETAIDSCCEYSFIRPVSQFGVAILPLLNDCEWNRNQVFMKKLITAARTEAVNYPRYLACEKNLNEPLSASELQVLKLICSNMSNNEICEILDIKLATVKTHVSHILAKLGVSRRSEAKTAAEKLHII